MALDKLVDSTQLDIDLESVADAIREKGGTSEALLFPSGFVTAIEAIQSGGNLIAKTAPSNDFTQIVTKDTEIRTVVYDIKAANRTVEGVGFWAIALNPQNNLIDNTEYAVTGKIDIIDANENILESYNVNTTFTWQSVAEQIIINDENAYVSHIAIGKNTANECKITTRFQKTANFGFKIGLSICEITNYDGLSSVTINAPKYPETLIEKWIKRASDFVNINWPDGITQIGAYAFANCKYFNTASLPSTITAINDYAFYNCNRLALTSLPNGITVIKAYSFYNCNRLALTSLPSSITAIREYAFNSCADLSLTSLPNGITNIESYAFYDCSNIKISNLPTSLTALGTAAFCNCAKITISSIPNTITSKTIPTYCFKSCTGITTMNIQSGITKIDSYAFQSCHNLVNLTLPDSITNISSYAFVNCRSLISVECNGAITTLATGAFNANASGITMQLQSVSFPQMALASQISTVFGNTTAGYACKSLEFVDIGKTAGIAANAFANCYSLETLVLRKTASVCTLGNVSAFLNTPLRGYDGRTATVYVPNALIASYKTATNWSTLYSAGTVTFEAIEGSDYELD